MNRNILGTLLNIQQENERAIDFENALTYLVGPIPLALAYPKGSRRTTTKSRWMDVILIYFSNMLKPEEFYKSQAKPTAYLIDLMGLIRAIAGLGSIYEELVLRVLDRLPKKYDRIDIVPDTYCQNSLKNPERTLRNINDFLKMERTRPF